MNRFEFNVTVTLPEGVVVFLTPIYSDTDSDQLTDIGFEAIPINAKTLVAQQTNAKLPHALLPEIEWTLVDKALYHRLSYEVIVPLERRCDGYLNEGGSFAFLPRFGSDIDSILRYVEGWREEIKENPEYWNRKRLRGAQARLEKEDE